MGSIYPRAELKEGLNTQHHAGESLSSTLNEENEGMEITCS